MPALHDAPDERRGRASAPRPFLAVPPFPHRRFEQFTRVSETSRQPPELGDCLALIREKRVGGAYWARRPDLPSSYVLVRSAITEPPFTTSVTDAEPVVVWLDTPPTMKLDDIVIVGACDPWHMLSGARAFVCHADDDVQLIARLLGVPVFVIDPDGGKPLTRSDSAEVLGRDLLSPAALYASPFDERLLTLTDVIELCGFWRALIDSNRDLQRGAGFAFWKQEAVLPLLWSGNAPSDFFRPEMADPGRGAVATWRSKVAPGILNRLESLAIPVVEVEDGFLRSDGLGADCVPPLSITVDRLGAYFDPSQPSELEHLLQSMDFPRPLLERAETLRQRIVAAGLGKYDRGNTPMKRPDGGRHHILVTGQVEDDRSILTGGAGLASNLELLHRVRAIAPDSFVIYKPHPDVVAGHRKGHVPDHLAREYADMVVSDASISSLIEMVDEVHVNTSLAGFEAVMRHKQVTTHGVPFYAGWGLTRDLGPVPARRTRRRSLDELVAATLLMYPRYLDPVCGLPCPAEVVVDRLCGASVSRPSFLVMARRAQGRIRRELQRMKR